MSKDSPGGFLSKVAQLVRGPGAAWGDSAQPPGQLTDKQALKAAIERKRRNDFVRKREFDMLRTIRKREQQNAQDVVARPSFFQSSVPSDNDGREQTIKKIDAIEAQMSTHWWQPVPGDEAPRSSQRLQAPPTDIAPLGEVAAHLQARLYHAGNTWGATQDGITTSSQPHTQPAAETHWPLPGASTRGGAASQAPHSLPVAFGDETTHSQALQGAQPASPDETGWQLAACLQVAGVEEAAVRFANSDDAGTERHLGQAVAHTSHGGVAADLRALLLDFFRATGRRESYELHVAEWARQHGDPVVAWSAIGEKVPAAAALPDHAVAGGSAPAVWTCPALLDVAAVARLEALVGASAAHLVLDWGALASADPAAAQRLLLLFERWAENDIAIVFVGTTNLRRSLRASTPSGRRENHPVWWQLRLASLRLMGRADEFDLAALDYCVTYGVTPPDWGQPRCHVQQLDSVPAMRPPATAPLVVPTGRLTGALLGDVTRALNAIAQPGTGQGAVGVDCSAVTRTDFVAAGALLQWSVALKDGGRQVELQNVHGLLAAFFHIVGIADVARVLPRPRAQG
ncbi:STAS domain-containing protein [Hydrogenophaga atypica]|uniref:STAS domain-containing protein n=1 Tax=Hydrogenophaga atypica TaxID=249409 RepID=A0ABW2QJF1_9BURK